MSRHFSEEAIANFRQCYMRHARFSEAWVEEWNDIRRDVLAAIEEDPSGETGRSIARRFKELTKRNAAAFSLIGNPEVREGLRKAGTDQRILTPALAQRVRESSTAGCAVHPQGDAERCSRTPDRGLPGLLQKISLIPN